MSRPSPTREKILAVGIDLLSEVGLSGLTIGGLAEKTGMSKSGLFAHFRSKEAVQIALLNQVGLLADTFVVAPAMAHPEGLPRLQALLGNWLGWPTRAGLSGGCPVAAALFEVDDVAGDVRNALIEVEGRWRKILGECAREAVMAGHLDAQLDVDQLVWELCGIYLGHHASTRLLRDASADRRAATALAALFDRAGVRKSP